MEVAVDENVGKSGEDSQKEKYLLFLLGEAEYGIEIRHVREIVGIQKISEVPDMPNFISGVINLRGQVIPVMDARIRFGLPQRKYDDRTCIIVVQIEGTSVGLVVDEVNEVVDIPDTQVEPPPRGNSGEYMQGLGKIGEDVKILLHIQNLLFENVSTEP